MPVIAVATGQQPIADRLTGFFSFFEMNEIFR